MFGSAGTIVLDSIVLFSALPLRFQAAIEQCQYVMASSNSFTLPSLHDHDIVDVCVDTTGTFVASCALDGTIAIYNLMIQQCSHHLELNQTPSCMTWIESKPGFYAIVVGSREGGLH